MTLKVAYFQPTILAIDQIPPVEFSKIYSLAETLHNQPHLNDADNPAISIRGGQQIQIYPNKLGLDVSWLTTWLETICQGYMELITAQSGATELKYCKPVVVSNMYISAPELDENSKPSDSKILFRLPQTKDIGKFIMNDTWKYDPTPGTVILFPSHVPHTVYPWKGQGHRTVMAFDVRLVAKDDTSGQS